ncbi:Zinc finger BED domain-containing protein DAYSLEEPER [Fusarium oxysporum f. sp. albedinis]|nr:Zinc finger BED domain-containing protein DAYSLEEPER [Fusarium oxysporum f. sp. albedinis]
MVRDGRKAFLARYSSKFRTLKCGIEWGDPMLDTHEYDGVSVSKWSRIFCDVIDRRLDSLITLGLAGFYAYTCNMETRCSITHVQRPKPWRKWEILTTVLPVNDRTVSSFP